MQQPEMLAVSEEQLFAIIGRLHVENLVLRSRMAELQQTISAEPEHEPELPRPVRATGS